MSAANPKPSAAQIACFNYLCALISARRELGFTPTETADWMSQRYQDAGVYSGERDPNKLVENLIKGRSAIYPQIEVVQNSEQTQITSRKWYTQPLAAAFFVFDLELADFEAFSQRLLQNHLTLTQSTAHIEHTSVQERILLKKRACC